MNDGSSVLASVAERIDISRNVYGHLMPLAARSAVWSHQSMFAS